MLSGHNCRSDDFKSIRSNCAVILALLVTDPGRWKGPGHMTYQTKDATDDTSCLVPDFLLEHLVGVAMVSSRVHMAQEEYQDVYRITYVPAALVPQSFLSDCQRSALSSLLTNVEVDNEAAAKRIVALLGDALSSAGSQFHLICLLLHLSQL